MKFSSTVFTATVLVALASNCSAKKYYNHRLATDKTGVWGPNPSHTYEHPGDRKEGRSLRMARRTEGEVPVPPPMESSGDTYDAGADDDALPPPIESSGDKDANDSMFYEAESLGFFKKGIDPEYFEWVNPDEIAPGEYTCGFMKPRLGSLNDINYPTIEVYVCARFAEIQPAPKGNMFAHCGGPGGLSDCVQTLEGDLGPDILSSYNMWAIDQRGIGRSSPSFIHEECSDFTFETNNVTGLSIPIPRDIARYDFSVNNADSIAASLQPIKDRVQRCWTCTTCGFHLGAVQDDGTTTDFHFLDYSGTRQLAEDILRMQILMNAPRMHLYGISYGTTVFATFATLFPADVGLFVLDSCSSAVQDHYHQAFTAAKGTNDRIDYIIYSCEARNIADPGSCPVDDMRACVNDLNAMLASGFGIQSGDGYGLLANIIGIVFANFDRAHEVCDAAAMGDILIINSLVAELSPDPPVAKPKRRQGVDDCSKPSSHFNQCLGPDYFIKSVNVPVNVVQAMDKAGLIYDEERFARETVEVNTKFPGAGTGVPAMRFHGEYATGFYWPSAIPLPPLGNPLTHGIIVGILYDPATPYVWAQEMRNGFKSSTLLTSQALQHGLGKTDPDCQMHVNAYFINGFVDFVDGQVCGADFASNQDLASVFGVWFEE